MGESSTCTNIVRYLFFAFNFIFWALGLVVLGIGIYSRVENDTWQDLIDADTYIAAANLLVAAGAIVAFIGFFGCCGAIKKLKILLGIYSALVILIFILEIAAGIYAYVKKDDVEEKLTKGVRKAVNKNYGLNTNTAEDGMTEIIDWFQKKVKCCGVEGPSDWKNSVWYSSKGRRDTSVPDTCCKTVTTGCGLGLATYNDSSIHTGGCVPEGKKWALDNLYLIGGVGVGIAIVELLAIAFAIGLICAFKKEDAGTTA